MLSLIFSFERTFAMNFAEPSGSSPIENPPTKVKMWQASIFLLNLSTDSNRFSLLKLFKTNTSTSNPSLSNAFLVSYSELVPGNTGISTFGLSTFSLYLKLFLGLLVFISKAFLSSSIYIG